MEQLEINIKKRVIGVDDGVKGLTIGQKSLMEKVELLVSLYESQSKTPLKIPGTEIEVLVKNCNPENKKIICKVLADLFKERITNEPSIKEDLAGLSEETIENLRLIVGDVFQKLVSKGIKEVDAVHRCLLLGVDSTSFQVLKDLINECADGRMTVRFREIENAVKEVPGYESCSLQAAMIEDEILKCLGKLVSKIEETTSLKHNNAASVRVQLSGKSLPTTSKNDLLRSEVKQMETREFDSHTLYERKVNKIDSGTPDSGTPHFAMAEIRNRTGAASEKVSKQPLKYRPVHEIKELGKFDTTDLYTDPLLTDEFRHRPLRIKIINSFLIIIDLCLIIMCGLTMFFYLMRILHLIETKSEVTQSQIDLFRYNPFIFQTDLDMIRAKYPSQSPRFWKIVNSSIRRLLTEEVDTYPAVLLFAIPKDASVTGTCISKAIIRSFNTIYSSPYFKDGYIYSGSLDSETPRKMKCDLNKKMKEKLNRGKGVVLDHIEKYPAEVALLLYRYCDGENAPYKGAAIILGMHVDSTKPLLERNVVDNFIYYLSKRGLDFNQMQALKWDITKRTGLESILDDLWEREIGIDVMRAFKSRIVKSVTVVKPEPNVHVKC